MSETSLYLALPPLPTARTILLDIPSDGTPPDLGILLPAMTTALTNDPIDGVTLATLANSSANCRRIAYDIVWSYQNSLPPLPDPLESLYTNPDQHGQVISYEEYYPYGSTSHQAVRAGVEAPKRYRYTGKERDPENGLYYHGGALLRAVAGPLDELRSGGPGGRDQRVRLRARQPGAAGRPHRLSGS